MGSGPVKIVLFWILALAAAYFDLRRRRIPNLLILAGILCGTLTAACGGGSEFLEGLVGSSLGLVLLLPFFMLGGVGGGDVKSLAVIGLFTGPSQLLTSFFWGACVGGCIAGLTLLVGSLPPIVTRKTAGKTDSFLNTLPYAGILFIIAALLMTVRA